MRDHLGVEVAPADALGYGAALVHDGQAWVLIDERPARGLGPAMAWATRAGVRDVHVVVDDAAGVLARRAASFVDPPAVWWAQGRDLHAVRPEPLAPPPPVDPRLEPLRDVIVAGGAEPVVEHGVLAGEVMGLEVCRAVLDADLGSPRLEVGVGAHDREAFFMVHGDVPPAESLARVVEAVRRHRRPDGPPHPLQQLGAERAMRSSLIDDPARVGLERLTAAQPPVPRPNLKDPTPCVAAGADAHGRAAVVVCSVGIDLDLVPFAADARAALGLEGARLLLALRPRDDVPVTRALAERLVEPAAAVHV